MYANKIITITRVSLHWNTAYTPCHYTDTIRLHWLTDDTRLLCTVLQVMHNYIVLINRCYTISLNWLTGDTLLHCTYIQVYTITLHRRTVDTRFTLLWLTGDTWWYIITLYWFTDDTWLTGDAEIYCTD